MLKKAVIAILALAACVAPSAASSQDTLKGLGRVHGYTGVVFDTRDARVDFLVDASRPDDPAARRYRTIHAAYAAAPPGTPEQPTVIGLMPDVYQLNGTPEDAGLVITKPNITLIGLTDDRRKVVLADNRGNQQGAVNNAWSLRVDADGFSAINLTILNYCNVDYDYPGDPSKSLKRRSGTITQALALQAAGDRHVYSHVAFLSRLDTIAIRAHRAYFSHVYLEGTDDFLGSRTTTSVWEDSEIHFIEGGGILFGGNATFIRTRFRATKPMQFYKAVVPPVALIESVLPDVPIAWHAWRQPPALNEHSLLYGTARESGRPVRAADIVDSAVGNPRRTLGRDLTEEQARAFNPWNLLHWNSEGKDDGWDPAGGRARYESYGVLPTRVTLTNGSPVIRTTEQPAEIRAEVFPRGSTKEIHWSTTSPHVRLSSATGDTVRVIPANDTGRTEVVAVRASADNGLHATAYVTVHPAFRAPPVLKGEPAVRWEGGTARLSYDLDLPKGRKDQSLISWFVCGDPACADAKRFAVSHADEPLRSVRATPAMAGRHLMAVIEPRHDLSLPGPARRAVSAAAAPRMPEPRRASLDIRTLADNGSPDLWDGEWSLIGGWTVEPPMDGEPRWGLRVAGAASTLLYTGRRDAGDMDLVVTFDTDKLEGQGFAMPSSSADDAALRSDILFKYDARTRTGYALRVWRTTQSSSATMFQIFRIADGRGSPISPMQLTGVLKPTTTMRISVRGNRVTVRGQNTSDDERLSLEAAIEPNDFAGAGITWPAARIGGSIVLRGLELNYAGP